MDLVLKIIDLFLYMAVFSCIYFDYVVVFEPGNNAL